LRPGILEALGENARILREVDENKPGSITTSIVRKLASARVVVVDITGWNPNVFFELGIRYALCNKVTVVVAQEETKVPFDIATQRVVWYNRYKPRLGRSAIADAIRRGLHDDAGSDGIVFDTFKSMSVSVPGVLESLGEELQAKRHIMSWDDYMRRIEVVVQWLGPAVNEGRYVPHAMLGVSNGGLIAADLIGKAVFAGRNTPVLGLWAQRYTKRPDFFENPFNEALVSAICAAATASGPASVLVVDDHFGTGGTAQQAIQFLVKHLGQDARILYLPLVYEPP
jgi:hypoxanthine phosphoribosyltransferase